MTRVWTNGSQWSYLLIQPQYFRSIKYVCLDRSLPPSSSTPLPVPLTWKHDELPVFTCDNETHTGSQWEMIPQRNWTEKEKIKDESQWSIHKSKNHQIIWFQPSRAQEHWGMPYYLITVVVVLIARQPNSELKVLHKSEQMADSLLSQLASVRLCAGRDLAAQVRRVTRRVRCTPGLHRLAGMHKNADTWSSLGDENHLQL